MNQLTVFAVVAVVVFPLAFGSAITTGFAVTDLDSGGGSIGEPDQTSDVNCGIGGIGSLVDCVRTLSDAISGAVQDGGQFAIEGAQVLFNNLGDIFISIGNSIQTLEDNLTHLETAANIVDSVGGVIADFAPGDTVEGLIDTMRSIQTLGAVGDVFVSLGESIQGIGEFAAAMLEFPQLLLGALNDIQVAIQDSVASITDGLIGVMEAFSLETLSEWADSITEQGEQIVEWIETVFGL